MKSPEPFIREVEDMHVCPTCLAEKPSAYTVLLKYNAMDIRFCRCTHCMESFKKNPNHYLDRLAGKTDFKGIIDCEVCP